MQQSPCDEFCTEISGEILLMQYEPARHATRCQCLDAFERVPAKQ